MLVARRMLDDGQFQDVVSWGVDGSSFVVKVRLVVPSLVLPRAQRLTLARLVRRT